MRAKFTGRLPAYEQFKFSHGLSIGQCASLCVNKRTLSSTLELLRSWRFILVRADSRFTVLYGHGHGHGHEIFILATKTERCERPDNMEFHVAGLVVSVSLTRRVMARQSTLTVC